MEPKRVTTNDSDEACALGWEKMDSQESGENGGGGGSGVQMRPVSPALKVGGVVLSVVSAPSLPLGAFNK